MLLSWRIFYQSQKIREIIEREDREHLQVEIDWIEEEEEEIILSKEYISPDQNFSFRYSSRWEKADKGIIDIFSSFAGDDISQEEIERYLDPDQIEEYQKEESLIEEELKDARMIFMANRITFPDLSLAVMALQKIPGEKGNDYLVNILEEDEEIEILEIEKLEENLVVVETIRWASNSPFLKSFFVAGKTEEGLYLLTLATPYPSGDRMDGEFRKIISSIEINP